jgi:hypothetical protein
MPPMRTISTGGRQKDHLTASELIEALERRVPHLEREGEIRIAGDAAALKQKVLKRLAELER